jgi:uncharacterized protein (TIGR02466 family)
MIKNQLLQYWPTIIGQFQNEEHHHIKEDLINFFNEYEKKNPKGNKQLHDKNYSGNFNLYQSEYNLHTEKNNTLHKVLNFIAKSILETAKTVNASYVKNLTNKSPTFNVKLIESWFIRYNKGGVVYPHNHGNFSWSCVYYVQIGEEKKKMNGSTYFMKPYNPQHPNDFGSNYMQNQQKIFEAEEGKLLVFPGYLYHGSHPFFGKKDRIIISTNSITEQNR